MDRRDFLAGGLAAAAATPGLRAAAAPRGERRAYRLAFAPHFGMFRHHAGDDLMAQLEFMAAKGFSAFEDNGMGGRDEKTQERIGAKLRELGMRMGVFVAHFANDKTFVSTDAAMRERILADMRKAVEVAQRVGATWCTVVPGAADPRRELDYQTAAAVDNLRAAAEVCEASGLVMVLEPLNPWSDHPGLFLTKAAQAYLICRAVDSPSCKILFDIYHQQVTEGHLMRNIDQAWSEIGYFQIGDNPGRKEPGTGEINYKNVFRHIHGKGFAGIYGMEHGNSQPGKEGEEAVLAAYRAADLD